MPYYTKYNTKSPCIFLVLVVQNVNLLKKIIEKNFDLNNRINFIFFIVDNRGGGERNKKKRENI
jgi:hypothetical protein